MPEYTIPIRCERDQAPADSAYSNCMNPDKDCKQIGEVVIKFDGEPYEIDINSLANIYEIPRCTQTGCRRYLRSSVFTTNQANRSQIYKLEDLRKKEYLAVQVNLFNVKPDHDEEFVTMNIREWPAFFCGSDDYKGTRVSYTTKPGCYKTENFWTTKEAFYDYVNRNREEFNRLSKQHLALCESFEYIGFLSEKFG
ncbi:MAG: hypothetical protein V1870_05800 [Candidatus Aenigmatarchaeota archaeon]